MWKIIGYKCLMESWTKGISDCIENGRVMVQYVNHHKSPSEGVRNWKVDVHVEDTSLNNLWRHRLTVSITKVLR